MVQKTNGQLLTEAREARHLLVTGKAVSRFVDQNGEQVEYSKTNLADLAAYIRDLEGLVSGTSFRPTGPIGFVF